MITNRRTFLVNGLRITAAAPLFPVLESLAHAPRPSAAERVLVVLQLSGGNDAVNMVVPHRQDAYFRLRPTLSLRRESLHALDDEHGLHPGMGKLSELFSEGQVAIVHGVGYPSPNRSHFRSMEICRHTGENFIDEECVTITPVLSFQSSRVLWAELVTPWDCLPGEVKLSVPRRDLHQSKRRMEILLPRC